MAPGPLIVKSDFSNVGPKCPHCGYVQTPDENFYFNQDGYDLDCADCGGWFEVRPEIAVSWATRAKTFE